MRRLIPLLCLLTLYSSASAQHFHDLYDLRASPTKPASMILRVAAGEGYVAGVHLSYPGGDSPTFVAPGADNRIDVLSLDSAGVLHVTQGTPAASPSPPDYPPDQAPICEVYVKSTTTSIVSYNDGVATHGYIRADVRPFLKGGQGLLSTDNALFASVGATGLGTFEGGVNAGKATGSQYVTIGGASAGYAEFLLQGGGATKWQIGKDTSDRFRIYDNTGAANTLLVTTGSPPAWGITGSVTVSSLLSAANLTDTGIAANQLVIGGGASPLYGDSDLTWDPASNTLSTPNISISGTITGEYLIDGGVLYKKAGTNAIWSDADFTYNDTTDTVSVKNLSLASGFALTLGGFTQGSVLLVGASSALAEDNANLFFNSTTKNLTVGGDLAVDGADIGLTADPDLMGLALNLLTVRGSETVQSWLNVGAGAYAATAGYIGAERLGLGVAPAYLLQVNLPAASTATPVHVGDGTYGVLVGGATGVANRLSPMMLFYPKDASDGGAMAMLIGQVDAASDTGTNPVFRLDARRVGAALTTRPAFAFFNYSSELLRILANGQHQLLAGVTAATPTPMLTFGSYYDNAGDASISHIDLYGGLYGFGISSNAVNYITGRHHHFMQNSALGSAAGVYISPYDNAIYGGTDNTIALGTSALGFTALYLSDANTTAPSAEGEIRDFGTRNVLQVFGGAAVQTLTSQLYALPAAVAETGNGAALTKNWCTYTLPYALRKAGNTFRVRAHGTAYLNAAVGEGRAIVVSLNLETAAGAVIATLAQQQDNVVAGGTNHYIGWHLEGSFTCESATVINNGGYGLVTYKTASPWPGRDAANANLWEQNASVTGLGATTNYVLALDVGVVSSGADAYCRVAEFEIHMN